ncbi:hypothetical protein Ccrd_011339, partial [Cynara cardunculus var. scolymus]
RPHFVTSFAQQIIGGKAGEITGSLKQDACQVEEEANEETKEEAPKDETKIQVEKISFRL